MIKKHIYVLALCGLSSTFVYGENIDTPKKVVFVQLDKNPQKAHEQLALLKNVDVLGINRQSHEAEIYVTEDELDKLKAENLSVFAKFGHEDELNTALEGYLNPTQVRDALQALNQKFPKLTNVFEFGKTHRNLPMMAVEISSQPGDSKRPVVMFNAMTHAREVMTTEVVMHIAHVLTDQYGKNDEVTYWLDHYRILLVPQVNPDGNTLVHSGQTMWRKNAYSVNNTIKGVDLNRNFPAYWNYCQGSSGSQDSEIYRGKSPGSEPEVQAMMNLVSSTKPVANISYHSYSEMIIYPFGCSNVPNPSKKLFHDVALKMKAAIRDDNNQLNTYSVGTTPELLYNADGSDDDWYWKEHGVLSYTIEVNSFGFRPNYAQWRDVTIQRQEGGWMAFLRQMQMSGFHGFIQSNQPEQITFSVKQLLSGHWVAFDADDMNKRFVLKSHEGLMYQLTGPGNYKVSFYKKDALVKTMDVRVENQNVDLGTIVID